VERLLPDPETVKVSKMLIQYNEHYVKLILQRLDLSVSLH